MIACVDCKFHDDGYGNNCRHPLVMRADPVYGQALETCHSARSVNGACGVEAKHFTESRMSRVRSFLGTCSVPSHQEKSP
jgi:hypothetical protein